jgi:hypothetical protein
MKAYARDVGTKGDIFYWKQRRDEKQYGVEGQRANKFYMWKDPSKYYMFADPKEWPSMTFHGKQMLWETGAPRALPPHCCCCGCCRCRPSPGRCVVLRESSPRFRRRPSHAGEAEPGAGAGATAS